MDIGSKLTMEKDWIKIHILNDDITISDIMEKYGIYNKEQLEIIHNSIFEFDITVNKKTGEIRLPVREGFHGYIQH